MIDKRLQYRMLIRNMRKMQEAGHLPVCDKLVLAVNTKDGKCTFHQLNED